MIADDQPLIRDGLAAILTMERNYTVVAKTGDGIETIEQAKLLHPQLILMDIHMPKLDGLQATQQIKLEFPDTKILILTTFEDEHYIMEAIRLGANGFLLKGADTEKILTTIEECLDGRISYPSAIQTHLIQALNSTAQLENSTPGRLQRSAGPNPALDDKIKKLSIQELNIVKHLKQGQTNQAIASHLHLTTGTVKNYLINIYKKLDVSNRSEAIAYLHEHDGVS
jgi:two-component system, NarL family, response regulator DegU